MYASARAGGCDYFSCLPPFIGETYPNGPSHLVGTAANFTCCQGTVTHGNLPWEMSFWYGGPEGSALKLQRYFWVRNGTPYWKTVAFTNIGTGGSWRLGAAKLSYSTHVEGTPTTYRLVQSSAPKSDAKKTWFVVWADKATVLGPTGKVGDSWNPGFYPGGPAYFP